MLQRAYMLLLFLFAVVSGIVSFLQYQEFPKESVALLGIFIVLNITFSYIYSFNMSSGTQISFIPNYGFPFILLTNPFFHFVFALISEVIISSTDKTIEKKERVWEILYNFSTMHLLNVGVYYGFYSVYKNGFEFDLLFVFIVAGLLTLSSMTSKLSLFFALKLNKQITDTFNYRQFFVNQTMHNVLMSSPAFMILIYSYTEQEYVLFAITLFLQVFVSKTLQKAGESLKQQAELDAYKEIAYKDPLTGSYNRRFLKERLGIIQKSKERTAIVVTDLDNFKRYNDNYNHDVGDQVIEWFVEKLNGYLLPDEYLIRSGGEEFILLLKTSTPEQIVKRIEHIRVMVSNTPATVIFDKEKLCLSCTASFGVAFYEGEDKQKVDELLIKADNLLYVSKKNGKNQVSYE